MGFIQKLCKGLMMLLMVAILSVLLGLVVEHLWNWLMPSIFGLRTITYWQAVGLFLLSKLLFGGIHKHGGHAGHRGWKRRMKQRWAQMTPEERERFRAGMRARRGCHWGHEDKEWFRDEIRSRWGQGPQDRPESGEPAKEKM